MVKRYSDQELQAFAQHYDTHGAVKLPGLLEPEVVERILEAMDKAAAHADDDMPTHAMSYGRAPGRMTIRYMWRVNPLIKKFLFQSDLVEAVARIVGSSQLRLWFDLTLIYDSGEPGVGGATSVIDYPDNNSRGKYIALMILTQGSVAGLFAGKIGMNIPGWLEAAQFSPAAANRSAFWFVAALAMLGVGFAWWGITYDRQRSGGRGRVSVVAELRGEFANLAGVFQHARVNRTFRVILFVACVVRSDFLIVASFLSLWVVGIAARQGIEPDAARAQVGDFFSCCPWPPWSCRYCQDSSLTERHG